MRSADSSDGPESLMTTELNLFCIYVNSHMSHSSPRASEASLIGRLGQIQYMSAPEVVHTHSVS